MSMSFKRKSEYVNKRYSKASDLFKAKKLLILCQEKYEALLRETQIKW